MPPKSSSAGVKPRFSVYVMMLILSFMALVIGSIMLYMEYQRYGTWKASSIRAPASAAVASLAGERGLAANDRVG